MNEESKKENKIIQNGTYENVDISIKNASALTEINGILTDINFNYNYSFTFYNDSILLEIFLNASVNGYTEQKYDIMTETLNGTFGNGSIGLMVNYSLYDEKAYAFAYVEHSKCYYDSSFKSDYIFKNLSGDVIRKSTKPIYLEIEKKY